MSHTPGPWSYEEPDVVGLPHLRAANGDAVATFLSEPWNSSDIPLIAAAPELYEALEAAYLVLTSQKTRLEEHVDAVTLARAALAKARADEGKENA